MDVKAYIGMAAAVPALVGGLYGSGSWVDSRYAHEEDLSLVEMRLNEKITSDRLNQIQSRIWRLEERYGEDHAQWPTEAKSELRELMERKVRLDRTLEKFDQSILQHQGQLPSGEMER